MAYTTLEEIRKHLNLDDFFTDDDDYIRQLILVAEDITAKRIDKKLSDCLTNEGVLEASVKHIIYLLVGHFYNNRETTTPLNIKEVPFAVEYLASLNKHYHIF